MLLSRQAFALVTFGALAIAAPAALAQAKPEDKPPEPAPGAPAPAPGAPPAAPAKTAKSPVRLMPKEGGWKIEELFDSINKTTGISILYDSGNATFKQAKVEFVGQHVIEEDQLFDWLQAVLSYRKLVLVPVGPKSPDEKQQWFVMDQADPNLKSRPVYIKETEIDDYADRDGLYVVTTLTLQNITDTTRVRNALSPLSTATAGIGRIQDIAGSRALIVGDFAPVVAAMKKLLQYIDVQNPKTDPRMEVVPLNYEVASELEPIITDLIQASDAGQQRAPRQQGQPEEEPEPKIIADNRLDALIIYATDAPMKKIKDLIVRLDIPSQARGRLHFRPLRHTDADDMAKLLDDLISSTSSTSSGTFAGSSRPRTNSNTRTPVRSNTGTNNQPNQGGALGGTSAIEGAPVIISDPKSNSLIVQASPTQWGLIDQLITKLDQARPQVLIETSLVELSLQDNLDIGVELFGAGSDIVVKDAAGNPIGISDNTNGFGNTSFGRSSVISTDVGGVQVPVNKSPIITTGFTAGIFKNGKLPFVLNAFQSSGRARILTQPSLVTNDNEQATISLEHQTSFKQTVRDNTNTSTDSFQQVTATSELSISPHISSDDYLRLDIQQTVSNFVQGSGIGGAPPDQTTRKIDTHVTLPDTYTVVLGGIITEDESSTVSKVPILGDIPVIGFFFRQTHDSSNPSHLFLFVTPHILRDTERFSDYHRLTWEKKLLQDDLFGSEVVFPGKHWAGPEVPRTAQSKLKLLEDSGELDAGRLKAPPTEEERKRMAEETIRSHEHEIVPAKPDVEPATPPAGPPKAAPEPPPPAPEPAKPDEAPKK
jgi:type II secretion system protein D